MKSYNLLPAENLGLVGLCRILFILTAFIPIVHASNTIEVTTTGFGENSDKAEANAIDQALRKALGEIVDAETVTENESVIKDQVLTFSSGFIKSKEVISQPEKDPDLGLFTVTIKFLIERSKVIERLKEAKIAIADVGGDAIWAEMITKMKVGEDGGRILEKFLWEELRPEPLLIARIVSRDEDGNLLRGNKAIPDKKFDLKKGTVELTFHIETFYHLEAYYEKIAPRMIQLLDKLASVKIAHAYPVVLIDNQNKPSKTFLTNYPIRRKYFDSLRIRTNGNIYSTCGISSYSPIGLENLNISSEENMIIFCSVGRDQYGTNGRYAIYAMNRVAYLPAFVYAPTRVTPLLNLILEAEDGSVIEHRKFSPNSGNTYGRDLEGMNFQEAYGLSSSLPSGIIKINNDFQSIRIEPVFSDGVKPMSDVLVLSYKLTLAQEDLKRLKRVKVFYDDLGHPQIDDSE